MIDPMYHRVIPRDLFNESKLLKCLGQLALIAHDGLDRNRNRLPDSLRIVHDGEAFEIEQDPSDGAIFCPAIRAYLGDVPLSLRCSLNNRQPYPITCTVDDEEASVFNDDGTLSNEFLGLLTTVAH
jgi:hypothetical protein